MLAAVALAVVATLPPTAAAAPRSNPRPATIPALRQWTGGHGVYRLPLRPVIVVTRRSLTPTARTFAADLRSLTRTRVSVRVAGRGTQASPGEITLSLNPRQMTLGREGYRLTIGGSITITAPTTAGVFYGTRTVLQLLHGRRTIPKGRARDWPRYSQRGLMIDLGRRVYTAGWIETEIRRLAYLKLNLLHLHLTDDQRWGIVSVTHPELASPGALTRAQLRAILRIAAAYHVMVVPEIDMPGHLGALLAKHPNLELKVAAGMTPPQTPESRKLDITNPAALAIVRQLLDEYLPLFPGRYWDVGSDEYLAPADEPLYPQLLAYAEQRYGPGATAKDAILGFDNSVDGIVRAHHKTLRAWHDELGNGGVLKANRDILADWWIDFSPLSEPRPPTPQQLLAAGHQILNDGWFPTYYTGDLGPIQGMPSMAKAYESWDVNQFCGPTVNDSFLEACYTIPASTPGNLGSTINAWDDHTMTLAQIEIGLSPRLAVIAQKTWDSPELTPTYAVFQQIIKRVG